METLMYSYKNRASNLCKEFKRGSLLELSLINSMYSLSTTPLITLPHFSLLNCKWTLQVEFLNNTLVYMELEVLKIGIFKIFKTKFQNL